MGAGRAVGDANLDKVDHVVVLMMENRSFDHMLGYLSLRDPASGVEGLRPEMGNADRAGTFHSVAPLGRRRADQKALDPGHSAADTREQLADGNGGFVRNFEASFARARRQHPLPSGVTFDPSLVVGYHEAHQVPVYDYLAREFAVCDHWFSSLPGPTWPNRLFSLTGGSADPADARARRRLPGPLRNVPIYDRPAFTRHLPDEAWRWYSHDPATLRLVDSHYRPGGTPGVGEDGNFAYFNRTTLFERHSFLDDARDGKLRPISWIDPNFVDFQLFGPPGSNDDHPPSNVMHGQELVLTLLQALMSSRSWERTMLVVVYDEHGGFFDHVDPTAFPVPGDPRASYGVRVPALVASPYIESGTVSHTVFDHTSLPKTILTRFASDPEAALAQMGSRTQHATHLGELLTRQTPRAFAPVEQELGDLVEIVRQWKLDGYEEHVLAQAELHDGFDQISQLQREILGGALELRGGGLPPGKP